MFERFAGLSLSCVAIITSAAALTVVVHLATAAPAPCCDDDLAAEIPPSEHHRVETAVVRMKSFDVPFARPASKVAGVNDYNVQQFLINIGIEPSSEDPGMELEFERFPSVGSPELVEVNRRWPERNLVKRTLVVIEY